MNIWTRLQTAQDPIASLYLYITIPINIWFIYKIMSTAWAIIIGNPVCF